MRKLFQTLIMGVAIMAMVTNLFAQGNGGGNKAPKASFNFSTADLTVDFDGSSSNDRGGGSITSWDWDFGDGNVGSGEFISHTYSASGDYTVTLTVTDNEAATDSESQTVSVTEPAANTPPTASFTFTTTDLTANFDGTGSSDSDGSISSWSWDFGDGNNGTGSTVSHAYAAAGDYTVALTVTDNEGATDSQSQTVSVNTTSSPNLVLNPDFETGDMSSWNSWNNALETSNVYAGSYSARINSGEGSVLQSVSGLQANTTYELKVVAKHSSVENSATLLAKDFDSAGSKITTTISGTTWAEYSLSFTTGSTNTTASVSVYKFSGDPIYVDNYRLTEVAPVNNAPTASFTYTTIDLTSDFDGTGSSDSDGSISSWSWDFGDGNNGSGSAVSHTYAAEGNYSVVLTVTDNEGAIDSQTQTVEISTSSSSDLTAPDQWVIIPNKKASEITSADVSDITVNGEPAVIGTNVRVKFYYDGAAIVPIFSGFSPLTVYSGSGQTGSSATAQKHTIYTTSSVPLGDNNISSFTLAKGYQATFSANEDGTGRSKVYIASESDLSVDLPVGLANDVSFLRVMEWNYVNKKGSDHYDQAALDALNVNWFYHWTWNDSTRDDQEFAPMTWGGGAAKNSMDDIIALDNVTHLLGFNESDNCNGQSGQWGDLCVIDTAVSVYKNLLKSGLRLATPSGTENATRNSSDWMSQFLQEAQNQNIRIDVVAVHWYDWGGWFNNSDPSPDPATVYNRFTNYMTNVHDMYGLPVMITEFNANPNRTAEVNKAFMELAIPWLESTDWIERYCWFEPNSGVAEMFDSNGNLTDVGIVWRDQVSNPSIPEATLASVNLQEVTLFAGARLADEGLKETIQKEAVFSIYPNPTFGEFTISLPGVEQAQLSVINMSGQLVHSATVMSDTYTVKGCDLKPGVYLVKYVDSNHNTFNRKVIVE